jgi:hypothetical protein
LAFGACQGVIYFSKYAQNLQHGEGPRNGDDFGAHQSEAGQGSRL